MGRLGILPNIVQVNSFNMRLLFQRIFQGRLPLLDPKKLKQVLLQEPNTDHLPSDLDHPFTNSNLYYHWKSVTGFL